MVERGYAQILFTVSPNIFSGSPTVPLGFSHCQPSKKFEFSI
jgi:hypothetical protein